MPLVREAVGALTDVAAQTMEIALPAGVEIGNLLTLHTAIEDNPTVTLNETGWTEVGEAQGNPSASDQTAKAWWKIATADDLSGTYTVDISGGVNETMQGFMIRWSGHDPTTPMDAIATTALQANNDTPDPAAITTVTDGAMVLVTLSATQADTLPRVMPSGYTEIVADGTADVIVVCEKVVASAGVEDPGVLDGFGTGADSAILTMAIRPAVSSGLPGYRGSMRGVGRGVGRGMG